MAFYVACDLDEGVLRYWPRTPVYEIDPLLYSPSIDERRAAQIAEARRSVDEPCVGVKLSDKQIRELEGYLSKQNIESMRGIDDAFMQKRSGSFCYRDGWRIDFYAESDTGRPPLELKDICSLSFMGDELPFEKVESYVVNELIPFGREAFLYDVRHKARPEKTREIVERALTVGLDAIEEILWHGNRRLLKELDNTTIGEHLSYQLSDDSFTVRYGKMISRACKLHEPPKCASVFGNEHVFEA